MRTAFGSDQAAIPNWHLFDDGRSLGERGSEGGEIVLDEEHDGGARITLERVSDQRILAITCGIHGWMVHTRFFGTEEAGRSEFHVMRAALTDLVDRACPTESDDVADMTAAVHAFVKRFP